MAKQKIQERQIDGGVFATGEINSTTGDQVQGLSEVARSGITFNGTNLYTVVTKGVYFIHGQKLISNGASAVYLGIDINGGRTRHGYVVGSAMADIIVSDLRELNVGDTIRFYQQNATSSAWSGPHSAYQIFMVKAT